VNATSTNESNVKSGNRAGSIGFTTGSPLAFDFAATRALGSDAARFALGFFTTFFGFRSPAMVPSTSPDDRRERAHTNAQQYSIFTTNFPMDVKRATPVPLKPDYSAPCVSDGF
jgi:hypothetical protein